jgi:hypothetical protein
VKSKYGDRQIDIALGHLLRAGVVLSAAVVLIGGAVYLARLGRRPPEYSAFRGEHSFRHISGVLSGVFSASGRAVIQPGLSPHPLPGSSGTISMWQ